MTTTTATGPSKPGQLPDRRQDESVRQQDDRHPRSFCFSIALLAFFKDWKHDGDLKPHGLAQTPLDHPLISTTVGRAAVVSGD